MPRLRDRPTPDLVVLGLGAIVAVILVGSTIGFMILEATGNDVDLNKLAARLSDVTNTLIGAIVGYLAGRGVTELPEEPTDEP